MAGTRQCRQCGAELGPNAPRGLCPKCLLRAGFDEPGGGRMDNDRNLLFGVLAVQLRQVTPAQLMDVAGAWATDPSRDLPTRLVEAGALSQEDRDFINDVVDRAIKAHGGDAAATLASFGGDELVHQSFRGAVMRTDSGEVRTTPAGGGPTDAIDPDSVPAVQETPGRYSHLGEHARGGMGRILLVHDQHLGRDVALKELMPPSSPESTTGQPSPVRQAVPVMARFLQEARITGQLEHPSIVPVYELGHRKDGTLYYTMKLVRGKTLAKALRDAATLRDRLALLPHFAGLCQAMAYAHSRGVVHRDIKPGNVMIGEFGETVVIDWGLAKVRGREDVHADGFAETLRAMHVGDEAAVAQTAYGHAIGTPAYMPPEQARGLIDQVDERSDVYGLGAVLFEILTGQLPFSGKNVQEVIEKVLSGDRTPIADVQPDTPPELAAICECAMAHEPAKRYQSAKELADEVQRFLSGALVQAYQYTFREHLSRWARRHTAILATVSACLLAGAALSAFYVTALRTANLELDHANAQLGNANVELERSLYQSEVVLAEDQVERGHCSSALKTIEDAPESLRNWEWGRLQYVCRRMVWATLSGHSSQVESALFSPDGRRIVTASNDKTAKIWDTESGKELVTLSGHSDGVRDAEFSPDGRHVVTASYDMTAKVWDVESGREMFTLSSVGSASFSPDGRHILTGSGYKTLKIWDAELGKELATLSGHSEDVLSASFSPDGRRVVSTSVDKTARIWDAETGKELATFSGHSNGVGSASFSPDGRRLVTASWDMTAKVWDAESGKELVTLSGHSGDVRCSEFSPDGRRVLTSSVDRTAKIWNAESGKDLATLSGHSGDVWSASFSSDGHRVATASQDGTAKVWDAESGRELATLSGHAGWVCSASFSPDSRRVVTASQDGTAQIWDVESSMDLAPIPPHLYGVNSASFSPDGRKVLISTGGTAEIWDTESGKELATLSGDSKNVWAASFSPDGRRVATVSIEKTAKIWDAESGKEMATLAGILGGMGSAASFSPDGRRVVIASEDRTAKIWDTASGKELATLSSDSTAVDSASFSPDGRRVVTGSYDKATIWDAESGKELATLFGHSDAVISASFSPNGSHVVTTSRDGTARIWDAELGRELATLSGHAGWVCSAAFNPDGRRVVTASWDSTARVWDAESGKELAILSGHSGFVWSAVFSPDGLRVLTASEDGTAKIWTAMPWREKDLPGDSSMKLDERLDLWNRQRISAAREATK